MVIAFLAINVRLENLGFKVLNCDKDDVRIECPDGDVRTMPMTDCWNMLTEVLDNDDSPKNVG